MVGTNNIIIIGKLGSGKSALANVLSGTEVFKEDDSSVAEVWRAKDKEFEVDLQEGNGEKIRYRVIDTIGLSGTMTTEQEKKELLEKFEEEIGVYIDESINQIFFVIDKKADEKVLNKFLWLNEYLFENRAFDYTTIVRTYFTHFRKKEKCEEDKKELIIFFNENNKKECKEVIDKFLKEKVIYVDNPPNNERIRNKSREKILEHLNKFGSEGAYQSDIRKWLDKNYPFENERKQITVLDISKRNLRGRLNLKGFTNLKRLNCSDNQLTNLNLSDCPNLVELKCNNNQLTNLNFLKSVVSLEKLEIQDNQSLSSQNLRVLENLDKLEELNIINTNLSKEWEYLLKNCRKLYCDSEEIMKELDKKNCFDNDKGGKKYYNLDQWRETDKQNSLAVKVIPLERLFIIRSNLKKFINKWGIREDNNENNRLKSCLTWSYNKISKLWKKEENLSELSKLKDPEDSSWQWRMNSTVQWVNRATLVAGGSLVLIGQSDTDNPNSQLYTQTGGVIAIAGPFIEILTSTLNDKIFEAKQKKWDEFITDTKNMLDSYHELLGILEKVEISKLGDVNQALKKLDEVADSFLESYDVDRNETISVFEIMEEGNRKKLAEDLSKKKIDEENKSQLDNIIKAIENLEEEVTKYRQGANDQENIERKSRVKRKAKEQQELENKLEEITIESENNQNTTIAIDEKEQIEENELITQTEVPPKSNK